MISSNQIKHIRFLRQKKFRDEHRQFTAEGSRLVLDLMDSRYKISGIYAEEGWIKTNQGKILEKSIPCTEIRESDMERITILSSPSPVLAIVEIPEDPVLPESVREELILALDGISDPGNLGTIIRIADWFGIGWVICSENMADLYNPKVVQASMGSIARTKVITADLLSVLPGLKEHLQVFGTFLSGENIYSTKLPSRGIIVIGNEANGITPEVSTHVNIRLTIPSFAGNGKGSSAESLNAAIATAVICSEFRRRNIV
jgi:RNA methyltransferase, TrmH family